MKKNYALIFFAFLCSILIGYSQTTIGIQDFETVPATPTMTYTGGSIATGTGPFPAGDNNFVSGSQGIEVNNGTAVVEFASVDASAYTNVYFTCRLASFSGVSGNGADTSDEVYVEVSTDGGTSWSQELEVQGFGNARWSFDTGTGLATTTYDGDNNATVFVPAGGGNRTTDGYSTIVVDGLPNSANLRVRLRMNNNAGNEFWVADDAEILGTAICTDAVDFANIQFPTASPQTINVGDNFNVFTQGVEPGITDANATAPGAGIEAWIGYSSTNNDPSVSAGWTWVPATYNVDVGANDEFQAEIGSGLAVGTYYYASRWRLNGCNFVYGGTGGFWNNDSVELIVEPYQVDFCNLQFPGIGTITLGDNFAVYGQVFEPGVTPGAGQGPNITAEIGYSTTNTDPSTWTDWIPATYNNACADCNGGQNDEYSADLGVAITTAGTYYYATRFTLNSGPYSYGGILADGSAGNFWDGTTYISGVLTVNNPPPADVVITEIMYNSTGTDDEWIEICNISGSAQVLNGHVIEYQGSPIFTFPSTGVTLADGDCITISLGSNGDGTYNNLCPFTPDYGIGASTNDTDNLNNTGANLSLFGADGTTLVDTVTYDDGDGADGDGGSLHVIDATLDNSLTSSNWWETINGGSPGTNALISPCTPVGPEINVEGTTANFPDISDGDTTPATFDGTDFGDVSVGGNSTNTFRIENFGGTLNLTISSVSVISGDVGDFSITSLPTSPIVALDFSLFDIEFSPTAVGIRTAVIEIRSNDGDEDPYTFTVEGNGLCVASSITAEPSSGPVGTVVTVTGTNLTTATATFNGLAATVNNISATQMEVIVPAGASSGNLEITDDLGCPGSTAFTVIESVISGCEGSGGTTPTDLFISEVTDANTGGLTYIEIYNGTGATVNLASYSVQFFNNGSATENGGLISLNNVNLVTDDTYVVAVSTGSTCAGIPGADGSYADQTGFGGVNFVANGDDHIRLYDGATHIDSWGEYLSNTWADPLGIGSEGAVFTRNNNASSLPNTTFNSSDWSIVDWTACADNDYSNIGIYDFSIGSPPSITVQPNLPVTTCNLTASVSVTATEGFAGGNPLAYQWYFTAPGDAGWTVVTNGATYSGATTATLNILDALNLDDYQYYCEVRENTATCYTASNAVQLNVARTIWDGTAWSNSAPDINTVAVINGDYDTSSDGSFSACQLIVNATHTLTIGANSYVEVENNLTVDGNISMNTSGSFVQNNDSGIVDGAVLSDKTRISVEKQTSFLNTFQEYTYWSSPVIGETIGDGLQEALDTRRFSFNAQNFLDATQETNNDNTASPGQDDIDDNGDDWTLENGAAVMQTGVGYASTHDPAIFFAPAQYIYVFQGAFNNGAITVPIYRNDAELNDNNWNFIGNPYPSAIDADLFLAANASIDQTVGATNGAIFFWSHNTPANGNTNGNEALNYTQSDYAIINGTGQTAGGDGVVPDRFIPSGQGFFVSMTNTATSTTVSGTIETTDIVFNNSMRVTGNNAQFFRSSQVAQFNKLRLNLISDNGIFNQILIGYVDGATNGDDGMYYDAYKNLSANANALIYSLLDNSTDLKYAIQGKAPSDLNIDEVIPLGFYTIIDEPTLYTLSIADVQGDFMTANTVYLRDNLLGIVHDLSNSDYVFTSVPTEDNTRFEILFQPETLSLTENEISPNDLIITELLDGKVKFSVGQNNIIEAVEIIDLVGRTIYKLQGSDSEEIFDLSNLSQSAYIAKVSLSNGQIITKKAIKRK